MQTTALCILLSTTAANKITFVFYQLHKEQVLWLTTRLKVYVHACEGASRFGSFLEEAASNRCLSGGHSTGTLHMF